MMRECEVHLASKRQFRPDSDFHDGGGGIAFSRSKISITLPLATAGRSSRFEDRSRRRTLEVNCEREKGAMSCQVKKELSDIEFITKRAEQ